ncbi:TPR repeat-containing protein [Candidatus Magnetomorum sp. HK-1]|nr:TPR repeat-containing protein [Candidatus Magnetomorum sp. HK-1]
MSLYQNELAPWEKKNQYYQNLQLGNNINDQVNHLNKQTKEMIETQLGTANSIIASQERISEKTDAVVRGVSNVEQGILELKAAFEWGISEVVWQIEQNRIVLKKILEVLMAPLDTQAKERRTRAEEAYINGWIEDAEEEFLESEKINKFDFSIHISLGIIYLFHRIDKPKALQYFKKEIKYSKPKSAFHTSFSLLYKALICYDMGNIEKAEKNSFEALTLTPTLSEAYYQNAQYNAQLIETDKCISHLEIAIKSDKLYCLKANSDIMFDPIRENVNNLFEKLKNDEKEKATLAFEILSLYGDNTFNL